MIRVVCECGQSYRASEQRRGQTVRCRTCHAMITIPEDAGRRQQGRSRQRSRSTDRSRKKSLSEAVGRSLPPQRGRKSRNSRHDNYAGTVLNDLFTGGASVWLKILGGTVAVPFLLVASRARLRRETIHDLFDNPSGLALTVGGGMVAGAVVGGLLSLRDIVSTRLAQRRPVALPLRLLFGKGLGSLMLWCFLITFLTGFIAIFTAV